MQAAKKMNLNALTENQSQALTKSTYENESYFLQHFKQSHISFACQSIAQQLRQDINRLLINKQFLSSSIPLENLHDYLSADLQAYNFNDGVNKISTFFYDTDLEFTKHYYAFLQLIRKEIIPVPFYFQATPTIRIHCPNGKNNNHYPRYHADVGYGHPPQEINFWLPLTELHPIQAHGFRVMDFENSKRILQSFDYFFPNLIEQAIHNPAFSAQCDLVSPEVSIEFGQALAFDSRCLHTGEPLKHQTRISIDIRILPVFEYEKLTIEYQGSGRSKIIFAPGHCYHPQHSDELFN